MLFCVFGIFGLPCGFISLGSMASYYQCSIKNGRNRPLNVDWSIGVKPCGCFSDLFEKKKNILDSPTTHQCQVLFPVFFLPSSISFVLGGHCRQDGAVDTAIPRRPCMSNEDAMVLHTQEMFVGVVLFVVLWMDCLFLYHSSDS